MKAPQTVQPSTAAQLPLPGRQFMRFILLFHIVFIAGMLFILLNRWQRAGSGWGWPEVNITLLVATQIALYVRFFAWPLRSPAVIEWFGFYFPVAFALWFITWRLEPAFEWMVLGYLGQLFGAVSPRYSVPGGLAAFLLWLPVKIGWEGLGRLSAREWFGYLALVVAWTALGLFLHKLTVTSAERAELIQELKAAQKQLELAGQRDAELAALRERERLARELHDSLGHGLVTLTVQLEAAQKLLPIDPARASTLIGEMKNLTRTSMEQLRRSLAGLRAPGLGERPLPQALQQLGSEIAERARIQIEIRIPQDLPSLSPALSEALWRVAQEGLANIERHANATEARLLVGIENNGAQTATGSNLACRAVVLRVTDNGVGLPPDAEVRPGHYGLRGLRERVEGLGGTIKLETNTPKGAAVEARLPLVQP